MFSEQFAIMLLVAATQMSNQGAIHPQDQVRMPPLAAERIAVSRKLDLRPTDTTTRRQVRMLAMQKREPLTPAPILVASK